MKWLRRLLNSDPWHVNFKPKYNCSSCRDFGVIKEAKIIAILMKRIDGSELGVKFAHPNEVNYEFKKCSYCDSLSSNKNLREDLDNVD